MRERSMLLTGCDGFIGGHIASTARAQGWRVVGVSRTGLEKARASATVDERVTLDLTDGDAEERLVAALDGVDAVVHAAARVQLFGRAAPVIAENVAVTERVMRAAARAGSPRVVFLSSASVLFERKEQKGLREDATPPRRCVNGYAESKKRCERVVEAYRGSSAILRPQAVIGPGDRTLLPPVVAAATGPSWRWMGTRDGAETDLISVGNLAEYCVRAAERSEATGVFHLSDGESEPIEQLFRRVFSALGLEVSEKRISRSAAKFVARTCEWPLWLVAPNREPLLTEFAVEVLTRTRTLHRARTLAQLGEPLATFRDGLEKAIRAQRELENSAATPWP